LPNLAKGVSNGMPKKGHDTFFEPGKTTGDFVVISAAGTTQTAWDGNLTKAMCEGIDDYYRDHSSVGRPMTYADLQDRLSVLIDTLPDCGLPQEPYVQGNLSRSLFGARRYDSEPYFQVAVSQESGKKTLVRVMGGSLFGIHREDVVAIFAPGTLRFSQSRPIAFAKVIACDTYTSEVRVFGSRSHPLTLQAARAQVRSPFSPYHALSNLATRDTPIRVQVEAVPVAQDRDGSWKVSAEPTNDRHRTSSAKWVTFRVRALRRNVRKGGAPADHRFIALIGYSPSEGARSLWPASSRSSEETRLLADGQWRYLGADGALKSSSETSALYTLRLPERRGGRLDVKLIGTDRPVDFSPLEVRRAVHVGSDRRRAAPTSDPHIAVDAIGLSALR
jgi:hypothetical protein